MPPGEKLRVIGDITKRLRSFRPARLNGSKSGSTRTVTVIFSHSACRISIIGNKVRFPPTPIKALEKTEETPQNTCGRTDERRVGKERVRPSRSRWSAYQD